MAEHEQNLGQQLDEVLIDVERRATLGRAFVGIVRRGQVQRDAAFIEELQGATHEDALHLAELQQEPDEGEIDETAAHFEHGAALEKSGLAFSDSGSLHIHIMDGGQFASTLQSIDRATATDSLRSHLESIVYLNLHDVEDTALADHETDLEELFRPDEVPSWARAYRAPDSSTPQEVQAIEQTIAYMPGIAEGLEHVGADASRGAVDLEDINKDGDLWRWALAGRMGFAPEIALPGSTGEVYEIFTNGKDWDVVAKMLRSARPGGRFVTTVGRRVSDIINEQMRGAAELIDEPRDAYVARMLASEQQIIDDETDTDEDDDYSFSDFRSSAEDLERQYDANREYAMRHLAALRAAAIDIHSALNGQ